MKKMYWSLIMLVPSYAPLLGKTGQSEREGMQVQSNELLQLLMPGSYHLRNLA